MKNRIIHFSSLRCHLAAGIMFSAQILFGQIGVYLIGDSTMADKTPEARPETGWGMPFRNFFDETVSIENHAKNGRSTRTFLAENLWQPVFDKLKPGDYVFIQFGHNDESKEKTDRYTPPVQFKDNLARFVNETRSKGAIPVLLTPVSRRRFDASGRVMESHTEYTALVCEVATRMQVQLIDLDKKSRALLDIYGPEKSKLLFLHLKPGEHPNYPNGKEDNTHFNEAGALEVAKLVLDGIQELKLDLAHRITKANR